MRRQPKGKPASLSTPSARNRFGCSPTRSGAGDEQGKSVRAAAGAGVADVAAVAGLAVVAAGAVVVARKRK